MSIEQYIKTDILEKRLADTSVLVVYDGEHRYQQLAQGIASDHCYVVDVSQGSLLTRQQAMSALSKLKSGKQLLVYVPKTAPLEEEEKQKE